MPQFRQRDAKSQQLRSVARRVSAQYAAQRHWNSHDHGHPNHCTDESAAHHDAADYHTTTKPTRAPVMG